MAWTVRAHPAVQAWQKELDHQTAQLVIAAIDLLSQDGPALRRPFVGEITNSRHKNMKELRPGSSGRSEIRILFAFDPTRQAILLVAGDKNGQWDTWYRENIPIADRRLDERLAQIAPTSKKRRQHG